MPSISLPEIEQARQRLSRATGAEYWRSLEELAESDALWRYLAEELPRFEGVLSAPVSRRDVLKLMAASMALAGLGGCTGQPEEHIVPYVNMPEYGVPGVARYFATAIVVAGYAHGVLAQSHEGRPTKIEGNPDHPATLGACDTFSQASVLSLYDPDRSTAVHQRGGISSFSALVGALEGRRRRWDDHAGRGLCVLTATLTSPSTHQHLQGLLKRWPEARWFRHEPVDRQAAMDGTRALFGQPLDARYRFAEAEVVVSLDADFLQAQPGFLRYAHDFAETRRPRDRGDHLSRLYVAESTPTITGAKADHRRSLVFAEVDGLARQLAAALGVSGGGETPDAWVRTAADDLKRAGARALVVPGDQQPPAVHTLAHAINHELGAIGTTVDYIEPVARSHRAEPLRKLITAMDAGEVQDLLILDTNPAYTAPADARFAERLQSVPWRLYWGSHYDETARLCQWAVPAAHELETWSDAAAFDGTLGLIQPLIRPLNGGRTALELLTAITDGVERDPHELLRSYWRERHGSGKDFDAFWRQALHDGVIPNTAHAPQNPAPRTDWQASLPPASESPTGLTLQFRPDPALWDGRYANNGWLQELPRPLTKLTWHNAVLVSPALAASRELREGDVVRLEAGGDTLEAPVYPLPGQPEGAVTVTFGQGRQHAGRVGDGVGFNAFALQAMESPWLRGVRITPVGEHRELAVTQNHHSMEGRDLLREADLETYRQHPEFAQRESPTESMYPEPWPASRRSEYAWGMSIDLSACIGCNACITACQSENNIPVVGPTEVARGREMFWIRVDRYFEGPVTGPRTAFQPIPCMHCENAPCEYVCPVEATQHNAEGINQMIYNRCVGTRYCSQNCPYKVRRFNWFDYTGAGSAYPAEPAVQNPDVTVRSRGVMEKCTYCVQRINAAKITAEVNDRPIPDGAIQTACQQACPTQAIVFGDLADEASHVSELKKSPLDYALLESENTRPRTTFLAAVRNTNPAMKDV